MKLLKIILLFGLGASLGACQKHAFSENIESSLSKKSQFNTASSSSIAGTSWALIAISSGNSSTNVASYNQTLSFSSNKVAEPATVENGTTSVNSNGDVTVSPGSIGSGGGFSPGNTGSGGGVVPGGQGGQVPQGPVNTPNQLVNSSGNGPRTRPPNIIQNPPVSSNQLQEFNGHAACNNFGGRFLDKDGAISNMEVEATMMSCAAQNLEGEYLGALNVAVSYVVNGNTLTIQCQNGVTLSFTRQ